MQVKLRKDWFAPDGTLYRASKGVYQFPQTWEELLPSSAVIIADEKQAAPKPAKTA